MLRFDAVGEGLNALKVLVASENKKVGALLSFQHSSKKQCGTCFLFESKENEVAQLLKEYPGEKFNQGEFTLEEMPSALHLRQTALSAAAMVLEMEEVGHAEEFLIKGFASALLQVSDVGNVIIYLSHSPCTTSDRAPSNSLPGWPQSCTAKLSKLAGQYPKYSFIVSYYKKYGYLETIKDSREAANFLKNLVKDRSNIGFGEI